MTFAQFIEDPNTGVIGAINTVVIPFIGALLFVVFFWGVIRYFFLHGDEEKGRAAGRQVALWGFIGIVVFFSVWGFVNLLLSTLGIAPSS